MERIDALTVLGILVVATVTAVVFDPLDGVLLGGVLGFVLAAVLRGRRMDWYGS
ncbi:hypothetical protein [Halorarius halobius]|uniref:hypothetical protein n=1 Tax=Halorarius halobius TaxID=2962671 RepID=UPI0020CEADEE|nr:hypothetical protein [Halorarius halobius]